MRDPLYRKCRGTIMLIFYDKTEIEYSIYNLQLPSDHSTDVMSKLLRLRWISLRIHTRTINIDMNNISSMICNIFACKIDATDHKTAICRFVNDNHLKPNAAMKIFDILDALHACLFAIRDIKSEDEVQYNYGRGCYLWRRRSFRIQDKMNERHEITYPTDNS